MESLLAEASAGLKVTRQTMKTYPRHTMSTLIFSGLETMLDLLLPVSGKQSHKDDLDSAKSTATGTARKVVTSHPWHAVPLASGITAAVVGAL